MIDPLWVPTKQKITSSNMDIFRRKLNDEFNLNLSNYSKLHRWSIQNIDDFWEYVWYDTKIKHSKSFNTIVDDENKMPGAKWFVGSELNFAENLLRIKSDKIALEFYGENKIKYTLTYNQLHALVSKVSYSLKKMGLCKGDRVAAIMPNIPETIVFMLASVSLGAIWSSCSPDFGVKGILDRFSQIEPKILFSTDGYLFKGKVIDITDNVYTIKNTISSIKNLIIVPYVNISIPFNFISWDEITNNNSDSIDYEQLPFDHPLYIMYSSGTTGKPKSIVHSAGGTLIQHFKELKYHVNLSSNDKIFYYTTCGWMMWNWLVSSLAFGATLVLYDGNPFFPEPSHLLKVMNENQLTIFGTSAKYIAHVKSLGIHPNKIGNFSKLKTILSTGSPLTDDLFDFVYKSWKKNVLLSSISGGTDIISCFALGNPCLPVNKGELQCLGLGMSVQSYDLNGKSKIDVKGELVCNKAFPSMPIYFWNDSSGEKFHSAYFDIYNNVWAHGDFILINQTGGVKIFGRSDSTLNPGGVRIGTSEIYETVNMIDCIEDSLAIGQKWNHDERIILFILMKKNITFNDSIKQKIIKRIKENCSPRHLPSFILPIKDIPYTINGKKVEVAVKNIINGIEPNNKESLSNPESLDMFKNIKELN